jgi:hypothetical protein
MGTVVSVELDAEEYQMLQVIKERFNAFSDEHTLRLALNSVYFRIIKE